MDPITHAALGAACSQALLYRKDRHNAWLVGGLAAMAPDLDVLIRSSYDPMTLFLYHRYFTHALIFIPIGAFLVALALLIFKRFRLHWPYTFLAALIGYSTHGLLDACTNYGTVWFWPFSMERVSWNIVSIVDPIVTLPLILGVAWTIIYHSRKGVLFALSFVACFFTFNTWQHHRAFLMMQTAARLNPMMHAMVFPKLASSTAWQGAIQSQDQLLAMNIIVPLFKPAYVTLIKRYPLFSSKNLPDYIKNSPSLLRDFQIFAWFTKGYMILVQQQPLTLADGRFLIDQSLSIALWSFQFSPTHPYAIKKNYLDISSIHQYR